MKYTIIRKEDEYFGIEGLILKSRQDDDFNVDTKGIVIAHDIIEHPAKSHPNAFIDEFMALGAIAFFRDYSWEVQSYSTNTRFSLEENIKSDIVGLLESYDGDLEDMPTPPIGSSRNKIINEAIQLAFKELRKYPDNIDTKDLTPTLRRKLSGWMATGERRFKERFRRHDLDALGNLFIKIAEAVKAMNNHGGYEFTLTVNFSNESVEWEDAYGESY